MQNLPGHPYTKKHLSPLKKHSSKHPPYTTRPLKVLYSIHRHSRRHLWSTPVPGAWWTGIAYCFPLTHLHKNSRKMGHPWTGGLWGLLCHNQVELPSRFSIIIHNDHKPLQKFLNGKNTNNKVNCWSLELATYNITFEWISCTHNKAVDCLSKLVDVPEPNAQVTSILVNTYAAAPADRPATHTWSKTKASIEVPSTDASKVNAPPPLTRDCRDTLLQM